MKKKTIALLLALMMLVGMAVGGTMAWLVADAPAITNTFTVGDINITLAETTGDDYAYIPGGKVAKDPIVTVTDDSESCYLFVKLEVSNNSATATVDGESVTADPIIDWDIATGWTPVDLSTKADISEAADKKNGTYYFYRTVEKGAADKSFYILEGETGDYVNGYVTVSEKVVKEMKGDITTNKPTLTISAAAVQSEYLTTGAADDLAKVIAELPDGF